MKTSRYAKAQFIGMIKEQEAGLPTAALCREHGMSNSFYIYGRLPLCKIFVDLI